MAKRLLALVLIVGLVALPTTAFAQTARKGAWVDEVVIVQEADPSAAITRLENGDIQLYADGIANPQLFRRVQGSKSLGYEQAFGSFVEYTFNPVGPILPNGTLNPFGVAAIREAMNWLIDRDYIVREIYGGLAKPRFLPISSVFADYARIADVAKVLERKYAYNPTKARQVIESEMAKLGATKVGGKWTYKGKPVTLINLIRSDDEQRKQIGDYVSQLLEGLGFTVTRRYGRSAELSPIWLRGDPSAGQWHLYTGAWVNTGIPRDEGDNIEFYYTDRGQPVPLWQAYKPGPELDELAEKLARRGYSSLEERKQMMARALELALQNSVRIWLVDRSSFIPRRSDVRVAADLAAGVQASALWAYTLRVGNRTGGTVRVGSSNVLVDPWNPIAGSNWTFDMFPIRATGEFPAMPDPHTGLYLPSYVERAEVYVKRGLPVGKTLGWVDLRFVDENKVPADAWIDWNARTQSFVTVGEKHRNGLTANVKVVVRYDRNLFNKIKWHDGSPMSLGDMIMSVIMTFDRAKPESRLYDESAAAVFEAFQQYFRGFRIVSRNPVVIEYYTDTYDLDAETTAYTASVFAWPYYTQGPAPWHTIALGKFAEEKRRLAFSAAKASELKVDWMNFVAGPSLQILKDELRNVRRQAYIPYEATLREFITTQEARARWENVGRWVDQKGHFWIGNGPFYLEKAFPVEKVVQLKRFTAYSEPADKWAGFGSPAIPAVSVTGANRIQPGAAATFDVRVTTGGRPYALRDIAEVKYLVFDARGRLALQGKAVGVRDGLWQVRLTADQTRTLPLGPARIEVIAVSKRVSMSASGGLDVVVRR